MEKQSWGRCLSEVGDPLRELFANVGRFGVLAASQNSSNTVRCTRSTLPFRCQERVWYWPKPDGFVHQVGAELPLRRTYALVGFECAGLENGISSRTWSRKSEVDLRASVLRFNAGDKEPAAIHLSMKW